jgi:type IX secretion system PorP/SprF family membrane protein
MNKKMKRIIVLASFVILAAAPALAQQVPMYSHYYYNKFLYNPALAGVQDYGQIYLINRTQWNNIPDAPRTKALTIDGPMKKKNIGIGVALFQDVAGQFNSTGAQAAYRYGIDFGNDQMLNFGLALGFLDNRIDFAEFLAKHNLDPVIMSAYQSTTGFDANLGINYTYKDLNIGVAVPQLIGNELAYEAIGNPVTGEIQYGLIRHFLTNISYDWDIKGDGTWFLQPTALIRATPGAPLQYDINAAFSYQKKYWVGAMYRSGYSATFSAGAKLANQFVIGYAYDYAIHADLSTYTKGASEFMIGYQFGGKVTDDPELKKALKNINEKINSNKGEVDSLGGEVKKNRDDIDGNRQDIDGNDDDIDDIRKKINSFQDFMDLFDKDGRLKLKGGADGQVFTFSNVYFETNKWDITGVYTSELDNLITIMKENPGMRIEVAGHADNRGSVSYNTWLSTKRSNAVRDYLIGKGVSSSQLEVKGYGEGDPASGVLSQNRRVEFKILSN